VVAFVEVCAIGTVCHHGVSVAIQAMKAEH
jgi:hypothetical protein